jgi:microcystin degradation protein MlrC
MRVVLAGIATETNSFSPIPSPLKNFGSGPGPLFGTDALNAFKDTRISLAGLYNVAKDWEAEIDVPVIGRCNTGAPVSDADYEVMAEKILESVSRGCDAILLGMHGALLTQSGSDDGWLLERLRKLAPDTPIGVSWDFHATMNPRKVHNATITRCYRTAPHTDTFENGQAVARLIRRVLDGEVSPVSVWGNIPVIGDSESPGMATASAVLAPVMAMAAEAERDPRVLACNVFGGCGVADTRESGPSCVVVTDNDAELAIRVRNRILSALWQRRAEFVCVHEPLSEAVAKAKAIKAGGAKGPVVLGDSCDSANCGGADDDMAVIREVMKQGLVDVAIAPIRDAEVAAAMHAAGNGATITVDLGHKVMPVDGFSAEPLRVTGTVSGLYDGQLVVTGPVFTGTRRDMGPCGCLTVGGVQFVVTTERAEPFDFGIYEKVGINPREKQYLILKGCFNFVPVYKEIAAEIIFCGGTGANRTVLQAGEAGLYKNLRRPIFPLDQNVTFDLTEVF